MRIKKGFTLVEALIAMAIIAFVSLLSVHMFMRVSPRVDKLKFKNANLSLKHAISNVLSNPSYYSEESALTDLDDVTFEDMHSEGGIRYGGVEKFRHILLRELGVRIAGNNIPCYMPVNSAEPKLTQLCYKSDNGAIWGIPDTDFINVGVVKQMNSTGAISKFVPVTIYFNNFTETVQGFYNYAVVIGVRADGSTSLLDSVVDCKNKLNKNYAQCNVEDMFAGLDMKDGKD